MRFSRNITIFFNIFRCKCPNILYYFTNLRVYVYQCKTEPSLKNNRERHIIFPDMIYSPVIKSHCIPRAALYSPEHIKFLIFASLLNSPRARRGYDKLRTLREIPRASLSLSLIYAGEKKILISVNSLSPER